jgi:hypothetical protein
MAFSICLIDSIRLAIIKYMTINSFVGRYNSSKGIIKSNHDRNDKITTTNKCKDYLQHYMCGGGGLGQTAV